MHDDRRLLGRRRTIALCLLAVLTACGGGAPAQTSDAAASASMCVASSGVPAMCDPPRSTWYNIQGFECGQCPVGARCTGIPETAEPFVGECK